MSERAWDFLDRRVLARIVFVDAVGRRVTSPVAVRAPDGVKLLFKRPGDIVVLEAPGLGEHTSAFLAPPAAPAPGAVALALDLTPSDPGLGARRFVVSLPRDPDPANAQNPDSLFRAVEVPLLPAPGATVGGLAAGFNVTVTRAGDGRRVENALVRLRPEGGRPRAMALTDAAGEAMLLVPGVPLSSPGAGAVVVPGIGAVVDAIVDPGLARFHAEADLAEARLAAGRRQSGFADPDDIETRLAANATPAQPVRLVAGRIGTATIAWTAP